MMERMKTTTTKIYVPALKAKAFWQMADAVCLRHPAFRSWSLKEVPQS
jgi:hypothetical protein